MAFNALFLGATMASGIGQRTAHDQYVPKFLAAKSEAFLSDPDTVRLTALAAEAGAYKYDFAGAGKVKYYSSGNDERYDELTRAADAAANRAAIAAEPEPDFWDQVAAFFSSLQHIGSGPLR